MPLYFGCTQTPLGAVFLTEDAYGVTSLGFSPLGLDLSRVDGELQTDIIPQLHAYFSRRSHTIEVPVHFTCSPFAQRVYRAAMAIPYGNAVSYGDLALRCGCPRGARAVGGALSRCPIPLIVPCHRVLGTGGRLGGYGSSPHHKEYLLTLEGIQYVRDPNHTL